MRQLPGTIEKLYIRKLKATKSVLYLSVALAVKDTELEAETLYKDEVRSSGSVFQNDFVHEVVCFPSIVYSISCKAVVVD